KLPSLASIRFLNLPPTLRSFSLAGVCQLGSGVFHCTMSAGVFHACQTFATGAFAVAFTVILVTCAIVFQFLLIRFESISTVQNYGGIFNDGCGENDNLGGKL